MTDGPQGVFRVRTERTIKTIYVVLADNKEDAEGRARSAAWRMGDNTNLIWFTERQDGVVVEVQ